MKWEIGETYKLYETLEASLCGNARLRRLIWITSQCMNLLLSQGSEWLSGSTVDVYGCGSIK